MTHHKRPRVLVVATSRKTRGGITSVIKAYESTPMWRDYHCRWIETHRDGGRLRKIWYLLTAFVEYIFLLPFYDIVHVHVSESMTIKRKFLFVTVAWMMRKKIVMHLHAFSPETSINGDSKTLYHWFFKKADCVIGLSLIWKKHIESAFSDIKNIQVLYNPCTTPVVDAYYKKQQQILYAGTINSRKGYRDFICAFGKIASEYPDWNIVLAGNGEIEQGRELAKELNIESRVEFVGWVNGASKDKVFKEASIFCLPSYAEGFPMAVLDAFSYGLPVVTTPVGGIPDIAVDGENMLLFDPGDIDSLAEKLRTLIEDDNLRQRLSAESSRLATTTFNLEDISKQLGGIYDSIV